MATATSTKLPDRIPLFPLPNVVLFPGMPLPLHIFELRYREMVEAAMAAEKTIGMVLLKPGFEADYEGRPPIFETGCAGVIERCDRLDDGRYNILLRGTSRFRVENEYPGASYRIASVATLSEPKGDAADLLALHPQLLASIGTASDGPAVLVLQSELAPDVFVNALCQTLALTPIERQSLLDCPTTLERARRLLEILQWKALDQVMGKSSKDTVH